MTTLLRSGSWILKVYGDEHPPVHVHIRTPDGEALVYLDGKVFNNGVDRRVLADALAWIAANGETIVTAWNTLNRERRR